MTAASQAIAAMSAGNVTFADDKVALRKTFHAIANKIDNSDELVADGHRDGDRFLRPRVPIVNVDISSTDRSLEDANPHVVAVNCGNRNVFEPQTRLSPGLDNGLHRFLHERKLKENGKQENRKTGTTACLGKFRPG
jgi:hypothetical protein